MPETEPSFQLIAAAYASVVSGRKKNLNSGQMKLS